ncbi:pentatricopeptide repeat-containing protein At3g16610-like [Silene latifolia]|uniref:pentatricopeptide repeat-containing protein At3g16610-like n=1 Tax=Silene latifolia TaxID=37657 RepID=UPI003D7745DA
MILNLKRCLPQCRNFVTSSHHQHFITSKLELCKKVEDLKPLKSLLIRTGLIDYKHVISEFIGQCFNLGTPDFALSVFYASENRSLLLQNLVIKHLCKLGLYQDVISVYKTCINSGCSSGDYTFPFVIKACAGLCDFRLGREIHCCVLRTGYDCNVVVQTALVDFYAKTGRVDIARKVFDGMSEWSLISCNALISGYCYNQLDYEALDVFRAIWEDSVKADVPTLASVIPICTRLGFQNLGRALHGYAMKAGFSQYESLTPALIALYASNGDVNLAKSLFDLSPVHNVAICTSMISAYAGNQNFEQAFELFSQMVRANIRPNAVTFVYVIPCCEKMHNLAHGESLHGCVIKYGLLNQVSVAPALISMYAKLGEIDSATYLFNQMSTKNLLAWNSIISVYVNQGLLHTSLEAVREMVVSGFGPNSISIINVLSACSKLHALALGKSAHGISIRKGFDSNLNISNLLLAFYSSCHLLHLSFKLFVTMPQKDSISWNTMISSCVNHGEKHTAEFLLSEMQQEGIPLDVVGLVSILPVYDEPSKLAQGMALHAYATKFGFISDIMLANALISMYCNCNYLDAAELIFGTMMRRCVVSWTSMITGYRSHNRHKEAIFLFKAMMNSGQKPSYITLISVLPGCSTLLQGKSVHSYAIRTGAMLQSTLVTSLVSMYSRFKNVMLCHILFEAGNKLDICLWNVMLSAFLEANHPEETFALFRELLQTKLPVDFVTILSLVSACGQLNSISLGNSILSFAIKRGFSNETNVWNALTDFYAKNGDIRMAKSVFDSLMYKDTVSWSTMINGYGLHGYGASAVALLSEMENSGIKPDDISYLNLLSACNHCGLSEQSKSILNSMIKCGMQPRTEHYACMVDLLGREGNLNEAYDIVMKLPGGLSVDMLESLLGACRVYGNVELGEKVGELLIERDPKNVIAYVTIHNLYAGAGRWKDANRIRNVMDEKELRKVAALSMLEGHT